MAAAISGVATLDWPSEAGVILSVAERRDVAIGVTVLSAVLAVLARGAGVGFGGAALLAPTLLQVLGVLPASGRTHVHVREGWILATLAGALGLLWLLRKPRGQLLLLPLAAIAIGGPLARHITAGASLDRPPLVLLTLDTLRADHLSALGGVGPFAHTPHLDAALARGRVYTRAFASVALTGPSHASMLSGRGVELHGVRANGVRVPDTLPWVPSKLRATGWSTRAWVSAAVLDAELGFSRGFDGFDSAFEDRLPRALTFLRWRGYRARAGTATGRSGEATLAAIDAFPRGSFTWVHLYDAHWPYTPTEGAARRVGLGSATPLPNTGLGRLLNPADPRWPSEEVARGKLLYRAELEDLDRLVGTLLAALPADASLVIAGDHGESLDEHDYAFSHGRLPFAPDTRTLLAVIAPDLSPGVFDTPVSLAAVAPTLRALAGLPGPRGLLDPLPDVPITSMSFAAGFPGARTDHPVLGHVAGVAVRTATLHRAWTQWSAQAGYDPVADPSELVALPLAEADAQLLEVAADAAAGTPSHAVEPDMNEALEALGYVAP